MAPVGSQIIVVLNWFDEVEHEVAAEASEAALKWFVRWLSPST